MTAGLPFNERPAHRQQVLSDRRASGPTKKTSDAFFEHSSAQRTNTDAVIVQAIRKEYPNLHLTVVPRASCDLVAYASAGNAGLAPIDTDKDRLLWRMYVPPASRLSGSPGVLGDDIKCGKYLLDWRGKEYVLYVVEGRDGNYPGRIVMQYVCSPSVDATNRLLLEAGAWNSELHDEVWIFDGGWWQKSAELYNSVQHASWDDVILDEKMKQAIQSDVSTFFDSRETYEKLKVPWKRGVIYYGPPGNGKTISIKAIMHMLYSRKEPVPTLYVRTLSSFAGPEASINSIFSLARRTAPCLLVFEDLDSIVTDDVRSYFLNAVDGIQKNDGILMIGSTNHLDRLDPGIAKRPSRFDRKYLFPNPNEKERAMYMQFWRHKLEDNKDLEFPEKLCPAVASITDGFSFAYLQEMMIASLLAIAHPENGNEDVPFGSGCLHMHAAASAGGRCTMEQSSQVKRGRDWSHLVSLLDARDGDLDRYVLWREIKKQVRILREEMGEGEGEA